MFFDRKCENCDHENDNIVPIDLDYFADFKYKKKNFLNYLLFSRRKKKYLQQKKLQVHKKYLTYKYPYFDNFVHFVESKSGNENDKLISTDPASHEKIDLLKLILIEFGFVELKEYPGLIHKLVRFTSLKMRYKKFAQKIKPHIKDQLTATLKSYISEAGLDYKKEQNLMLYYFIRNGLFNHKLKYDKKMSYDDNYFENLNIKKAQNKLLNVSKKLHKKILLENFKSYLEKFNKSSVS